MLIFVRSGIGNKPLYMNKIQYGLLGKISKGPTDTKYGNQLTAS